MQKHKKTLFLPERRRKMPGNLKQYLRKGRVYRRSELAQWSTSIDRELSGLVKDGTLQKLSQGLYYCPKGSAFGKTPPDETMLVREFLKDNRFLLTSPNAYNNLGVGTTQLYNQRIVYNHKRHGDFKLGNRNFSFRMKHHFPHRLTEEFLLVDLVNNIDSLLEDGDMVLENIKAKVPAMNRKKLAENVAAYGNSKTQRLFRPLIHSQDD